MSLSKTEAKKRFLALTKKSSGILITAHYSPDDDAIGSTLALKHYLANLYPDKTITVCFTGNCSNRFSSFSGFSDIRFVVDIASIAPEFDLAIFLDGGQYSRFSRQDDLTPLSKMSTICIDHHSSPPDDFTLTYIDKDATSTSEIIMDLFFKKIEVPAAEALLLGILGDTGTFNYLRPHQLKTFDNVKKLIKILGVEIQEFKSRYSKISQNVFTIISEYIKNTKFIDLADNPSYQYSYVLPEFIKDGNYSDGETSEASHIYMAHYLRVIDGYSWGFIASPKQDGISVSFRSLPRSVNVRRIAEILEIGGGHDRAGGGLFKPERWGKQLNLDFAIKYLIDWIATNKLELS